MNVPRLLLISLVMTISISLPTNAAPYKHEYLDQLRLETLLDRIKHQNDIQAYTFLIGVTTGIFWSNALMLTLDRPLLFCPLKNMQFSDLVVLDILEKRRECCGEKPVSVGVMMALRTQFPCPDE